MTPWVRGSAPAPLATARVPWSNDASVSAPFATPAPPPGQATAPAPSPSRARRLAAHLPAIGAALTFRFACYAVMTALALWNEGRPAPSLPDAVLEHVPYVPWVARVNYLAWLALYLPVAALLCWRAPAVFVRYTVTGGLVSLARGLTIAATGLGPPPPLEPGLGIQGRGFGEAFLALVSPWQVFANDAMTVTLTKDLFFSGHTATTFLLLLYAWRERALRAPALAGHVVVVATVFLSHLHYTIDVVGAYAVTFAIFALREGWPTPGRGGSPSRW